MIAFQILFVSRFQIQNSLCLHIPVPQESANEDDEVDRPPPGSPPSIVYGSRRGEHQFYLVFPDPSCDNEESSSPVRLLAREPLLFDT